MNAQPAKAVRLALDHGELKPTVQYLREVVIPFIKVAWPNTGYDMTRVIELLANMLAAQPNTRWHLRPKRNQPGLGRLLDSIEIGSWIACECGWRLDEKHEKLDKSRPATAAIRKAMKIWGIKQSRAYQCLEDYRLLLRGELGFSPEFTDDPPKTNSVKSRGPQ